MTRPAIVFPRIYELMKKAQKKLLKNPLFSSQAHSAINDPWDTQRIPAPAPFNTAVNMSKN